MGGFNSIITLKSSRVSKPNHKFETRDVMVKVVAKQNRVCFKGNLKEQYIF